MKRASLSDYINAVFIRNDGREFKITGFSRASAGGIEIWGQDPTQPMLQVIGHFVGNSLNEWSMEAGPVISQIDKLDEENEQKSAFLAEWCEQNEL